MAPLAERLARRLGKERVLFDRFHEAELARPDLDVYLPRLYRDHTTLIVVVLSPDYGRKRWCGLEWRWIRQLILESAQERIMLLRLGDPGDLSELGIVAGDGYLDIARRPAAEVAARIEERLLQAGIALPATEEPSSPMPTKSSASPGPGSAPTTTPPPTPTPTPTPGSPPPWSRSSSSWRWLSRRWPLLAGLGGGAALLVGLLLGPASLARWQLERGDQAFLLYAKGDGAQWERAVEAWQRAARLDHRSATAQARLGFLADMQNELAPAETAWRRALALQPDPDPEARRHRNGLANVLMQQPGRRADALRLFDGDNNHPRSALDAAMLRWREPTQLPRALDAVSGRALADALAGPAGTQKEAWGFKQGNQLLVFENLGHQRCLLNGVQAATAHQLGRGPASPPLASADCAGVASQLQELLCGRLQQSVATNPRATVTGRWLGCPAPIREGSAPPAGTTG